MTDTLHSLRVDGLSRSFAGRRVVDDVSFVVDPGRPVGLLGANGAGKTTTLRLLSGFLPPTRGRVTVCGVDLAAEPLRAKRLLGYLPESVPSYGELRVDELLRHRAALKGLRGERARGRIAAVVEACDLGDVRRRLVGQLSKGFRQRVGLADALLAEPRVLLLDEPTDGLDPRQRQELLARVVELAKSAAVLLSSHVLDEVQAVCGRVVLLDGGRVVGQGTLDELAAPTFFVDARGDGEILRTALTGVAGVHSVERTGEGERWRFCVRADRDVAEELARAVVAQGQLRGLRPAGLRELFSSLAGERA